MDIVMYSRRDGFTCFECSVFGASVGKLRESFPNEMLHSGLSWYWRSKMPGLDEIGRTKDRLLTLLEPNTVRDLIQDVEYDEDGYGKDIDVFGVDLSKTLREALLKDEVEQFSAGTSQALRIVLIRINDSSTEHIFVPSEPVPEVLKLLTLWGIDPARAKRKYPYKRLNLASFEARFGLSEK